MNWTNCIRRYLPKTAEVMSLICLFKPVSSSATGYRAASASSALLVKPAFSVSQSSRSLLKDSFSFSIAVRALVSSSLAFTAFACWDFTFSCKSAVQASLLLSSAYNSEDMSVTGYIFSKYKAYNKLCTSYLGANAYLLCFTTSFIKSPEQCKHYP